MTPASPPAAAPRWPTLLALTVAVAGVHLALLLGPVSWAPVTAAPHPAHGAVAANLPSEGRNTAAMVGGASSLPMAQVSTVRWIVPTQAAQPTAASAAPPARPKTVAAGPATPQREARTEPERVAVGMAADDENTAGGPPESTDTPPAETVALAGSDSTPPAPEPMPEPAPAPIETAVSEQASTPGEERLAAATHTQRPEPAARPPAQPPTTTRLDYAVTGRIKGIAYNAEGALDWTLADGRYSARMEMKVFLLGSRVQTSSGHVGPNGLSPERFADKSRSEKAAHFDAEQNRIRFSNNAPDAVLLPGAQDRLSLFLQLAGLLQARPQAYLSGQTIEMPVVGTGDADVWRFVVGDEVTLSLPAGELRARQIKRLPRKEFDSTVEMWLAPELQHLPVRLRVTQSNGDVADQQLSRRP